jgi:hypothetical protein
LFNTPLDQAQIDFENEGGETYICGNPPYLGSTWQSDEQKSDLKERYLNHHKNLEIPRLCSRLVHEGRRLRYAYKRCCSFVSTNSICQGQQVPILWPLIFKTGHEIAFAHTSFKWANLASHNAGVTVVIVGISNHIGKNNEDCFLSLMMAQQHGKGQLRT